MREPSFWWRDAGVASSLLAPAAMAYGARCRTAPRGRPGGAPACRSYARGIGQLAVAARRQLALALARLLALAGERPVFLTRGYGGRLAGPVRVDPARHRALDVGDEPSCRLPRVAPTIVARDRVAGARMAIDSDGSVIVMDDGFRILPLPRTFRCSSSMAGAASATAGSSPPVRCGRRCEASLRAAMRWW